MNRREFSKSLLAAGSAPPALRAELLTSSITEVERADNHPSATSTAGFPAQSYTPFGYLDNPYHSWALHPSGILRSVPPLGLGIYYPAGPGGYFDYHKNAIYQAILRVGFRFGEKVYYEPDEFRQYGARVTASHHSKNILTLVVQIPPIALTTSFFQVNEHTLACLLTLANKSSSAVDAEVFAVERLQLGASEWWGRDGIAGFYDSERDCNILRSFAAGPVFTLTADLPSASQLVSGTDDAVNKWMAGVSPKGFAAPKSLAATAYYPDPLSAGMSWKLALRQAQALTCSIFLSREVNQAAAVAEGLAARSSAAAIHTRKRGEDDLFWSRAPRLDGDFPESWIRSWVYDFETLRMMVRRPLGVYKHPWDAMQIQAPRNVLAETSIDMWTLSYADAKTAQTVLLGQFQDAILPNVPCMREDGTMNMVAADGSECGTSLQWCYPFYCIESVYLRTADREWLAEIYPFLAKHLEWTLRNRTDRDGWIVAKCSWESGMDASGRFLLKQPTGGELIDFVRVAELQAAMSHAARTMERYARLLSEPGGGTRWGQLAATYAEKTRRLWFEGWFYDVDARTGKPIIIPGHREITQVGPVMCGVATPEQVRAMIPAMHEYRSNQTFWLEWPSHVLPYAESLWRAGEREYLSEVLYGIITRVYASMDRSEVQPEKRLGWPGVSCEMWGLEGARGGEGYGWGATLPAHIIRSVFGFRETEELHSSRFTLGPNLPRALWGEGKSFRLRTLHYRDRVFDLSYSCQPGGRKLLIGVTPVGPSAPTLRVTDEAGRQLDVHIVRGAWSFEAENHAVYSVELS